LLSALVFISSLHRINNDPVCVERHIFSEIVTYLVQDCGTCLCKLQSFLCLLFLIHGLLKLNITSDIINVQKYDNFKVQVHNAVQMFNVLGL